MAVDRIVETEVQYASINRRLLAVVIDLAIMVMILTPLTYLINYLLFNNQNFAQVMEGYLMRAPHQDGVIQFSDFASYALNSGMLYVFLASQFISVFTVALFEVGFWWWKSATPGKMITRCRIIDADTGQNIGLKQALIRFLGYIVSTLPFCIGFIMMDFTKKNRALHDMIAGTLVIVEPKKKRLARS